MLKKLLTVGLALTMMFAVTACSSKDSDSDKPNDNNTSDNTKQERPFTESNGTKVELGDTGKSVDEAPKVDAGGISSMVAYLKVYLDDSDWQWFGIRYENDTDKKQSVSDCKVTQITLDYDTITEEENHHSIKTIVFVTQNGELPMNGKTTSHKNIFKMLGNPGQNTDGHLHYTDDQGYKYEFVTENIKGILTRVAITYPTN